MNELIEIDGKMLSNNPLVFIFYRQATGRDLASDQVRAAKTAKTFELIRDEILIENESTLLNNLTEESLRALDEFSIDQFIINLYYAGRCAMEGKQLPYVEEISEMPFDLLTDNKLIEKLFSILNVKKNVGAGGNSKKK